MIIGINGYAGSGKDTLGAMLVSHGQVLYKQDWKVKKLAYKLKGMAALLLGVPEEKFEERDFKDSFLAKEWNECRDSMSARELLIRLAKSVREKVHLNAFIIALFNDYKPIGGWPEYGVTEDGKHIPVGYNCIMPDWIITDVRYRNEAQYIKDQGGIVIRINRMIAADLLSGPGGLYMHESETELDDWKFDTTISNDGTFEELYTKAEEVMKHLFSKD